MNVFRSRIRASIANEALQSALDGNSARRRKARAAAFATLPDWRERRQRAHAVRAEVIAHLDDYLDKFTAKIQENGIIVHHAAAAEEAVQIVLEIARAHNARLLAKSKSMVSEEIELNHALEAAGLRVVETDLGEYIVQLRGERPSHIITPAIHLRRHEVGRLFQEKLGIPYTEDIPTLTAAARRTLREVFLTADIGLSGVNFGVAATGTLCIVTNEGNGRMVTTLPPVHIALMGIERLVPTLDDLALMLSLLPRSATAQKLSAYTQLIHSPRRASDPDGAEERHLILVDNGRSGLRNSPLREALYCIRCGACLNACPVFREIGGHAYVGSDGSIAPYPGPIGSVVSPGLLGLEQFGRLAQASSLCGACREACPVDIDLPRLLTLVRAGKTGSDGTGLSFPTKTGLRAYSRIAASPRRFSASQRLAALGARLLSPFSAWIRLPAFTGWGLSRDFPRPAARPFRARFSRMDAASAAAIPAKAAEKPPELRVPTVDDDQVERFTAELTALGGRAYRIHRREISERVISFLRERGIDAAQMWEGIPGMDAARLTQAGLRVVRSGDGAIRAGVTGARAGIAETGTLVILGGRGQPLTASLLPEIHIAVLQASEIVTSLEEALNLPGVREASAATLVAGPSRTGDIEMTLTIGVHGPKELHVFVVDD